MDDDPCLPGAKVARRVVGQHRVRHQAVGRVHRHGSAGAAHHAAAHPVGVCGKHFADGTAGELAARPVRAGGAMVPAGKAVAIGGAKAACMMAAAAIAGLLGTGGVIAGLLGSATGDPGGIAATGLQLGALGSGGLANGAPIAGALGPFAAELGPGDRRFAVGPEFGGPAAGRHVGGTAASVPEPASLGLFLIAIGSALLARGLHRRRQAAMARAAPMRARRQG